MTVRETYQPEHRPTIPPGTPGPPAARLCDSGWGETGHLNPGGQGSCWTLV